MDTQKGLSRRSWRTALALILAASASALAAVAAPAATTPTATPTNPPTTAGVPGHLSVHIEGQADNAVEGRDFEYEIVAHNDGPGDVTDARLDVSLPREYKLDRTLSRDQDKHTFIRSHGRIRTYAIPELRPGEDVFLRLDGHFNLHDRSQSGNTFVAEVELFSPTSGRDTRRALTDVFIKHRHRHHHHNNNPGGTACRGGDLILSGGSDPNDPIDVDDDLLVRLNGHKIFENNDEFASPIPPIHFKADPGDKLQVQASNSTFFDGPESIDPLYLHCDATDETQVLDSQGFSAGGGGFGEVFYDKTFTIESLSSNSVSPHGQSGKDHGAGQDQGNGEGESSDNDQSGDQGDSRGDKGPEDNS